MMRTANAGGGAGGASTSYSKVPGSNTRQAASNIVNGTASHSGRAAGNVKPPTMNGRGGPNVRAANKNVSNANSSVGRRPGSRDADSDERMAESRPQRNGIPAAQRSGSAQRKAAAAAYNSSAGLGADAIGTRGKNGFANFKPQASGQGSKESVFEYTDSLMEQLGTPEMLVKDLKMAKRDIETLKNQLQVKEKSVAVYRADCTKLRKENIDLKKELAELKEKLRAKDAQLQAQQNQPLQ